MGFNSGFKGLMVPEVHDKTECFHVMVGL